MTSRRVPIRAQTRSESNIQFKNLVRPSALDIRTVAEPSANALYSICRTKANQVMMMFHRGYAIPTEEQIWIDCAKDENILVQKARTMLEMKMPDVIRTYMNRSYVLEKKCLTSQTTFNYYPYLFREGANELAIGEFFYNDESGQWILRRNEPELFDTRSFTTEVVYVDSLNLGDYALNTFSEVAAKIVVFTGDEKEFRRELEKKVTYRMMGVEIFHISELFVDYFQHWLVPHQKILGDAHRFELLSSHLMIRGASDSFSKIPNSSITESNLPTVHHTDIVVRYLGGMAGDIVYWSNPSYISTFMMNEFGYMLVVGHKQQQVRTSSEPATDGGQQDLAQDEMEEDDLDEEEEADDGADDFGGQGDEEDS